MRFHSLFPLVLMLAMTSAFPIQAAEGDVHKAMLLVEGLIDAGPGADGLAWAVAH
ncbi:MAG: hypothetical protein WA628_16340 [Terriglobales bacterium]